MPWIAEARKLGCVYLQTLCVRAVVHEPFAWLHGGRPTVLRSLCVGHWTGLATSGVVLASFPSQPGKLVSTPCNAPACMHVLLTVPPSALCMLITYLLLLLACCVAAAALKPDTPCVWGPVLVNPFSVPPPHPLVFTESCPTPPSLTIPCCQATPATTAFTLNPPKECM